MQQIVQSVLDEHVFIDKRLNSTDALIRLRLQRLRVNTIEGHARQLQIPRETLRRSLNKLVALDWGFLTRLPNVRGLVFVPSFPLDVEQFAVAKLERLRDEVTFAGEMLMRSVLYITVDDHDFRDNARPRGFVSGSGGGRLEIDRWYREARVAFEFNGSQHYEANNRFHKNIREFEQQQLRDTLKAGLCMRAGIQYIEIAPTELKFDMIVNKARLWLPLRPIQRNRPLVGTLSSMCESYVNRVRGNRTPVRNVTF